MRDTGEKTARGILNTPERCAVCGADSLSSARVLCKKYGTYICMSHCNECKYHSTEVSSMWCMHWLIVRRTKTMNEKCKSCWCHFCTNIKECPIQKPNPCARCVDIDEKLRPVFNRTNTACPSFRHE